MHPSKDLDLNATQEQEDLLDQELLKARRKLLAQKAFRHKLECKSRELDKELAEMDKVSNTLQSWDKIAHNENVPRVDDLLRYMAVQAEDLRQSTKTLVETIEEKGVADRAIDNESDQNKSLQEVLEKLMEQHKSKASSSSSSSS
ncbi:hypothetical protein LRAMOSA06844 [Lichtheimia ramosa]|uniref:Uncharacterized protein n=1 Tax=Lichtheimia ramosa TaxID=688394 RepID=A0A077WB92_9FUNG|nr:hypothetical protein LRAMOSA06844 [Lichtheimia ramosa]